MKGLMFLGCIIILMSLPVKATDFVIVHAKPENPDETHEVYIIPLLSSEISTEGIPHEGILAAHWQAAELDHIDNFNITHDEDTNIYQLPYHPDGEEFHLADPEENKGYSVSAQQIKDIDTLALENLFRGKTPLPAPDKLVGVGYHYNDRTYTDPPIYHALDNEVYQKVLSLIRKGLEKVTGQIYTNTPTIVTKPGSEPRPVNMLLEGDYPSPNGTPVQIQIYQCGLIYLEVPEQALPPTSLPSGTESVASLTETVSTKAPDSPPVIKKVKATPFRQQAPETAHTQPVLPSSQPITSTRFPHMKNSLIMRQHIISEVTSDSSPRILPAHPGVQAFLQRCLTYQRQTRLSEGETKELSQKEKTTHCKCRASMCQKNYCVCFREKRNCSHMCHCKSPCHNMLSNNFTAAKPLMEKFEVNEDKLLTHKTGCKCTKGCEQNYCECRAARALCSDKCHSGQTCKNLTRHDRPPIIATPSMPQHLEILEIQIRPHETRKD